MIKFDVLQLTTFAIPKPTQSSTRSSTETSTQSSTTSPTQSSTQTSLLPSPSFPTLTLPNQPPLLLNTSFPTLTSTNVLSLDNYKFTPDEIKEIQTFIMETKLPKEIIEISTNYEIKDQSTKYHTCWFFSFILYK